MTFAVSGLLVVFLPELYIVIQSRSKNLDLLLDLSVCKTEGNIWNVLLRKYILTAVTSSQKTGFLIT